MTAKVRSKHDPDYYSLQKAELMWYRMLSDICDNWNPLYDGELIRHLFDWYESCLQQKICPTPTPISPGTTTVTSCSPSASSCSETSSPLSSSVAAGEGSGPGFVACTKTITTTEPWHCTVTAPVHTSTYSSDCSCCDLTTSTLPPRVAVRCKDPLTTVLDKNATEDRDRCVRGSASCSVFW